MHLNYILLPALIGDAAPLPRAPVRRGKSYSVCSLFLELLVDSTPVVKSMNNDVAGEGIRSS